MNKILYLIMVQFGISLVISNLVLADWPKLCQVSRDEMKAIYEQLNLSSEQKQSLEDNRKKNHVRIKEMMERISELRLELTQELEKSQLDATKIDQIKDELNQLQSELTDLKLEGIMEVRDILTPEQYNLFQELTR